MTWAMCGRNVAADTGDQKGEAYNLYLQNTIFAGVTKAPLHVVLHKLHEELQQVHAMLASPKLLEARLTAYEAAQRRHDPNRLKRGADAMAELQSSGALAIFECPSPSSNNHPAPAAAAVAPTPPPSAMPIDFADFDPAVLDDICGTAPACWPSPDTEAPASPLQVLLRSDSCVKCNGHAAKNCDLRCCKRCCVAQIGPCGISNHEKAKLSDHPVYADFRQRLKAAMSSQTTVFISYKSKANRLGLGCRPIVPLHWTEVQNGLAEVMLVATCISNPMSPQDKNFYLLRMLRVELQPF
jgi:hypothetical protein